MKVFAKDPDVQLGTGHGQFELSMLCPLSKLRWTLEWFPPIKSDGTTLTTQFHHPPKKKKNSKLEIEWY